MDGTDDRSSAPTRMLMVEDNPSDVELILHQVHKDNFDAIHRVSIDEHEFRNALADFTPQLILSDFSLPNFDGLAALRIARTEAASTPFIFVSGTIGEERAIEALKSGASDYVLKDNLRRLVPAIRGAMRQYEIARARDIAEDMLRRSESRLQDIINSSADWIWECDAALRVTFSSPSVSDILGYTRHELLNRPAASLLDVSSYESLHAAIAAARDDTPSASPVVLRWLRKDGRPRWLERKMVALRAEDGSLRGFRGIDRDVTPRIMQEARIARLNRTVRFLNGANSAIVRIRDRHELLREACRLAVQIGGYAMATVYLNNPAGGEPLVSRVVDSKLADTRRPYRESLEGTGPVGRAMATGEVVVIADLHDHQVAVPEREVLIAAGFRSCCALPLKVDGTTIGVALLHAAEINVFSEAELKLLLQVTGNIAFSLQYLRSKESAEYLEYFDTLTALANRSLYLQRLENMLKAATVDENELVLLVFDVAGLKTINDGLGHQAGDLVLQLVAERLKGSFQDTNCLSHLGGGCFAVCASYTRNDTLATTQLRERVEYLFAKPFGVSEQELRLSIRSGFAAFPEDGQEADALLHHARTALDHAKQSGEHYMRHSPGMNVAASERLSLTNGLRAAVAQQSFVLHYQPKTRLDDGSVDGVEALLRWPQSSASPAVFVPLLESLELIDEVGRWVITRALSEGRDWMPASPAAGFRVAVNVSPFQLRREEFADEVLQAIAGAGALPSQLEIEVTESMLMADSLRAGSILGRLRDAGITVAIDDFGTGHSSLQVLSRLPVDVLKIDRSFVRDIHVNERHRMVVQTTITLAQALGMKTVAEGVELPQQVEVLKELGCDAIQGYLVLKPAPAADLGAWLRSAPRSGDAP
jgi:diguanylate cyclase (GGDEF)-like protein/PAS domain S-box-containing protein